MWGKAFGVDRDMSSDKLRWKKYESDQEVLRENMGDFSV